MNSNQIKDLFEDVRKKDLTMINNKGVKCKENYSGMALIFKGFGFKLKWVRAIFLTPNLIEEQKKEVKMWLLDNNKIGFIF